MTMTRETDAETIATLRAQLDSTLKDRALIMAELDTTKKLADAMEGEAHAHIKLWGDALRRADAAEARVAERDAAVAAAWDERDRFEAALGRACLVGGTTYLIERAESAEAKLAERGAEIARLRADAVKIKPLVWHDCTDETSHDDGCQYEVEPQGKWFRLLRASVGPSTYMGDFDKRSGAKAAAQADHDARIRAGTEGGE
jgi:hypothetical protein